jgi:hypothetical protein
MPQSSEAGPSPMRMTAGIMAACLICLWGALEYSSAESAYQHQNHDPYLIADQATRFAPFESSVPPNAILGYLSDAAAGSVADSTMFTSATYTLAPRLVERGVRHEYVLGNFTRPADFAALGRGNGLRLQQDFGNGVVLFRKDPKP